MGNINALIVEDESRSRLHLQNLLTSLCPDVTVVAHAEDLNEAGIVLKNLHVPLDVAFLDIKLPDGLVFEWLDKLEKIDFDVIFITAFNDYMNEAFDYSGVGYVLKPINPDKLVDAVKRIKPGNGKAVMEKIKETQEIITKTRDPEIICISSTDGYRFLNINDIMRLEAADNYTTVYTSDKEKYTVSKPIKIFETTTNQKNFFRIHKSHIINIHFVERYARMDNEVYMKDGKVLLVARRRRPEFLDFLDSMRYDK